MPKAASLIALLALTCGCAAAAEHRNSLGVAFNHITVLAPDYDRELGFWKTLGAVERPTAAPAPGARFTLVDFPDLSVAIREIRGSSGGGSVGSIVDHIGFVVPDPAKFFVMATAAGNKVEHPNAANLSQAFLTSPAGVRVEIQQDQMLTIPIRGHDAYFRVLSPLETQAWYVKMFGAEPGKRGNNEAANITGRDTVFNLTFSPVKESVQPLKGRALDHIGFAVHLPQFLTRLEGLGVTVDEPMRILPDGRRLAFVLDPWGTRIELLDEHPTTTQ